MSDQFKAIVINQTENNFTREVKSLEKSFFKSGDILVDIIDEQMKEENLEYRNNTNN